MNKTEEPQDTNKDLDSLFDYIIELQSDRLNKITNIKNIALYIGHFAILGFLLLLTFRVSFTFSWFYLLPLALGSILAYTTFLNMYLKLQDILHEELAKLKNEDSSINIGSILSYFSLNVSSLCFCLYVLLTCLKLKGVITTEWNVMAIPIFISCGICLFFLIFILPAFLTNKLYIELVTIFIYFLATFMFLIFINLKLDTEIGSTYKQVFLPLILAFSLHLGFCFIVLVTSKEGLRLKAIYTLAIAILLTVAVITPLSLDKEIMMPAFVATLLVLSAVLLLVYEDLSALFSPNSEDDEILGEKVV
jgi:hypothetical protein